MKKNKKTFFIISIIILAILFFGLVLVHAIFYAPADSVDLPISLIPSPLTLQKVTSSTTTENIKKADKAYPKQLRIPSIKVNAKVQYVGITKNGKMATPNNFTDVGWFEYGTVPGGKGSAIIAGHVDNGLAFPAVFANLENVKTGDDIYVDTVGGKTIHFKVISAKDYDPEAKTEAVFNQNDGNYLKLITCAGVWSEIYKTHNKRLIVTAEQI
jgi:LPXTG-site transpeptidase (sortase) family protein